MGITTKRGDKGKTSLFCGTEVSKDDLRVEICGSIDEVSSFLGMAKSLANDKRIEDVVENIQKDLMVLCSEIATANPIVSAKLKKRVGKDLICVLEKEIDCFENGCGVRLREFCIQGENPTSSAIDIARSIIRRIERRCVTMRKKSVLANENIIIYLNRLSDLLFLLARFSERPAKHKK